MATTTTSPVAPEWDLTDRLIKARRIADLSQTEMAERLGIGRRSIARYEDGQHPKRALLLAWAQVTNVPVDWLETGTSQSTWNRASAILTATRSAVDARSQNAA